MSERLFGGDTFSGIVDEDFLQQVKELLVEDVVGWDDILGWLVR